MWATLYLSLLFVTLDKARDFARWSNQSTLELGLDVGGGLTWLAL